MFIRVNRNTVIAFDLDDTLYHEIDFLKSAYKAIAQRLQGDQWQLLYVEMFSLYRNRENVFDKLISEYEITKDELLSFYRNHKPEIKPFEGVVTMLSEIKKQEGHIAIITDGRVVTQMAKIEALGLSDFINHIVISEALGTEKPSVQNYRTVMEKFKEASDFYFIGDNFKKDFITPNKLAWTTLGLIDKGLNIHCNAHRFLSEEHKPQFLFGSYHDLTIVAGN